MELKRGSSRGLFGAAAVLAGWTLAGCVNPPSQNYRSSWQSAETDTVSSRSWTNLAEIGLQDTVGPDLEYRATERVIVTDRSLESPGSDVQSTELLHQPSLDLVTTFGLLRWTQGYEIQQIDRNIRDAPDQQFDRSDVLQKLEWAPEDLPKVTTWLDFRTNKDDRFIDQETLETLFQIEQVIGPVDYQYSFEMERLTDSIPDLERDRTAHLFRGNYRDSWFDGALTGSLGVFVDERTQEERAGGSGGVTVPILPTTGLSAVDATPQIVTLPPNALLIDGDQLSSAGINIGGFASGGEINWNMGVELPPGSLADQVLLYTSTPVDPLFANQFSFSVWASDDNNFWSLVSSSASYTYEGALRRFRISFPRLSSRFLKVVNTTSPAISEAVLVSELEPLTVTAPSGSGSTVRSDNSVRNATGSLSWRVYPDLLLTYNLFLQGADNESGGVATRDEQRVDNGLTALWTPHRKVDVTLRGEYQDTRDEVRVDESFLFLNGFVIYRPLDTLDTTLSVTETQRDRGGQSDLDTRAAQIGSTAQLLDTLRASVGWEVNDQEDFPNQRDIRRNILSASLTAEMTPELDLTLTGLRNVATVEGPGAGGIPDPSENRYVTTLIYRPSTRFAADAEIAWVDTFAGSGWDQRYRLDWLPFQDGSLDLQLNFNRINETSAVQQTTDTYQALARWTMNPHAFLELNLSTQVRDSERTDLVTVSFNATL